MLSVALGWFLAGTIYAPAFSKSHGMGGSSRRTGRSPIERVFAPFAKHNPQMAALMVKDVKTFFRDTAQWAQVLIFFGILLIYNVNIQTMSASPIDQPLYKNLTSFLNLGAASMTLAPTLTMECRNSRPPSMMISTWAWRASSRATVGLCVTMVARRPAGPSQTTSRGSFSRQCSA